MAETCDTAEVGIAALGQAPMLLTAAGVAKIMSCSPRSVYRLADQGLIPRPLRLGGMVRWPAQTITKWIADGCPSPCMAAS